MKDTVSKSNGAKGGQQKDSATNPMRSAVRFPLRLEVLIETEQGEKNATTEDVSASGVLFSMDELPAIDSRVEFTMTMPGAIMGNTKDVTVHCIGRIVRHERSGSVSRAAAMIDEYILKA